MANIGSIVRKNLRDLSNSMELRELNRQLDWMWKKILGGLTSKDFSDSGIRSMVEVVEKTVASEITADEVTTNILKVALAEMMVAKIGVAKIDYAQIVDMYAERVFTDTGIAGEFRMDKLKVYQAQIVDLIVSSFRLVSDDGKVYKVTVDQEGDLVTEYLEDQDTWFENGKIPDGYSAVASELTVGEVTAGRLYVAGAADIMKLTAKTLLADEAWIRELTTSNIIGGKSLTIIAGEAEGAASAAKNAVKTYRQESAPDVADGVKNGDLWIKPSTGAISQADAIEFVLDENGDLYLNHGSGDDHEAEFDDDDPTILTASFPVALGTDGEIISMPVTWMLVRDQALLNEITGNATLKVDVEYALSDSNTTAPTTDWTTTAPKQAENKYIWSRTVTYFGDGSKSTGAASCLSTSLGKGISQIIEQYAVSDNAETAPTDDWSETVPTAGANQCIWTRSEIVYVDGSKSHTPPQVQAQRYADILTEALKDTVDGKTTVFYQTGQPANANEGDLWYDTDADPVMIYRYSGSAWDDVTNSMLQKALEAAGEAKDIADKKIVTFAQDEAPTSDMSEGDLWIDTNDGNKLHRYNGTAWVAYQDASIEDVRNELSNEIIDVKSNAQNAGIILGNTVAKIDKIHNYVEITGEGLFLKDQEKASVLKINSGSVSIGTNLVEAKGFSQLAANYVQFGDYQLRRATGGGLVFKKI